MKFRKAQTILILLLLSLIASNCKDSMADNIEREASFINLDLVLRVDKSSVIIGDHSAKFEVEASYSNKFPEMITDKVKFTIGDQSVLDIFTDGTMVSVGTGSTDIYVTYDGKKSNIINFSVFPVQTTSEAPEIAYPQSGTVIKDGATAGIGAQFVWSKPFGASSYEFEIYSEATYSTLIHKASLKENESFYKVTDVLLPRSYYWRVRADTSSAWQTVDSDGKPLIFYALDDTFYVDGNSTVSEPMATWEKQGTQDRPYKKIQDAINKANSLGIKTVKVAAATTYVETLILFSGIKLEGGYESSGWARDITLYTTSVKSATAVGHRAVNLSSGTFSGFTILGSGIASGNALLIQKCNEVFSVQNNIIRGLPDLGGFITGNIIIRKEGNALLKNNIIYSPSDIYASSGIKISNSSPVIESNTIYAGDNSTSYSVGIVIISGGPVVLKNTITMGINSTTLDAGIVAVTGGRPLILKNNIISRDGNSPKLYFTSLESIESLIYYNNFNGTAVSNNNMCGIRLIYTNSKIIGNQLDIPACTTAGCLSCGVFAAGGKLVIENNIISIKNGNSTSSGISLDKSNALVKRNTIGVASSIISSGILIGSGINNIIENIIFSSGGVNSYGIYENGLTNDPFNLERNLIFNHSIALYRDENLTLINDVNSNGILNGAPDNELDAVALGTSQNNTSLASGQSIIDVFNAGYSASDSTSWSLLGMGPADRDNSSGYSTGDSGANLFPAASINYEPVAFAGDHRFNIKTGQVNSIVGRVYDGNSTNGGIASQQWQLVTKPGSSSCTATCLNNASSLKVSFTPDVQGQYRLRLTATDNGLTNDGSMASPLSATDEINVWAYTNATRHDSYDFFPKTLLDNNTTTSTTTIAGKANSISLVAIRINLTHSETSELTLKLKSPVGTEINLSSNKGTGSNFASTLFDQFSTTTIASGSSPFWGSYRPEQAFSAFNGEDPNGIWTLTVIDNATGNTGQVESWSLVIND